MSGLRVIAGAAKGRRLSFVPGDTTRPISDRVKENLFNILGPEIVGTSFLDLFAGTGGVGIEALSRGASYARFYDLARKAIRTIHENLAITKLAERAEVLHRDALVVLAGDPDRAFDTIFIAPPQYKGLWMDALKALDVNPGWLEETGWVVVQIDPREYEEVDLGALELFDRRKYGNTELLFFRLS